MPPCLSCYDVNVLENLHGSTFRAFSKTSVFYRSGEDTRLKLKTVLVFTKCLMPGSHGILQVMGLHFTAFGPVVVSFAAVIWMSHNAPPKEQKLGIWGAVRDIYKTAAKETSD